MGDSEPQNAVRAKQSVNRDPDSSLDLEPDINLEREFDAVRKKIHLREPIGLALKVVGIASVH